MPPLKCSARIQHEQTIVAGRARGIPVTEDIGACDWEGMTDEEYAREHSILGEQVVCPRHQALLEHSIARSDGADD